MGSHSSFDHDQPDRLLRSNSNLPQEAPSPQKLFYSIRRAILDTTESSDLSFESITPETGLQLASSFCEDPEIERVRPRISYNSVSLSLTARLMPTPVHDAHQTWLVRELYNMVFSNFLTDEEHMHLNFGVGTTFRGFAAPYAFSSKEPDTYLLPDSERFPAVVVETGYSESWPRLERDKDLWLRGGAPYVKLVLLIKWSKTAAGRVKGEVQVHNRSADGSPNLLQTESIFPAPPVNPNRTIEVTREQLFGATVFPGRNPADSYQLSVANLRTKAEANIRRMGYIPA